MSRKELCLRFHVKVPPARLVWTLAALLVACAGSELGSENVTLSTYYPAPSGVYTQMLTTQNTYLARDGGNVGIGTASPSAKLEVKGLAAFDQAAILKNAGYLKGTPCSPEGALSYDYVDHALIYCGASGVWQSPGVTSVGAAPLLLSNNGSGPSRGSQGWWIGNNGSGFTGTGGVVVQNIGAGRNCVAVLATVGESNDVGDKPAFACRYDPATGNVLAQTHDNYDADCVWICTN